MLAEHWLAIILKTKGEIFDMREDLGSGIGIRQNSSRMITLLRARAGVYAEVKVVQRFYFFFALALPVASLVVVFHAQKVKVWVGLVALVVGAVDVMFLDPWRKRRIKTAARIQEEFDCEVLSMPKNTFTAGANAAPEEIRRYADKFKKADSRKFENWYPQTVEDLPLPIARLVCQRTNLWYDSNLRETYRFALCFITVIYFLSLLAFFRQFTVAEFILVALIPFGPFFTWVAREYHRQGDTIALVNRLLSEIDRSLEKLAMLRGPKAEARARELQDAIFAHRSSSPLVSDFVYRLKRPSLEPLMQAGAIEFVARARSAAGATK